MDVALALVAAALIGTALTIVFVRAPQLLAPVALVALPLRLPIAYGEGTYNLLLPLYLVIAAAVVAHLIAVHSGKARLAFVPRTTLHWLLLAAVVLYLAGAIYSVDSAKALEQFVFFYLPFLLLFALLAEVKWTAELIRICLFVLVGLALLFTVVGSYEYETRHLLLNPKVVSSNQFESYFRVNSIFFDPNIYGRFLAIVMLAVTAAMLWSGRTRDVVIATVVLAVLWAGLLLSFSQSSFVALLVGLAVLAALRFSVKKTLAVCAGLVALAAVVVLVAPSLVRLDYSSNRSLDKATSGRLDLITGGLDLFAQRPLYGYGSGGFAREYRIQNKASSERAASASHTIPVTVAAEQGVVGLAVYLALLVVAFMTLFKGASRDPARAAIAAAFTALVVHTMLYAAFLEDPLSWVLLGAGVALAQVRRCGG